MSRPRRSKDRRGFLHFPSLFVLRFLLHFVAGVLEIEASFPPAVIDELKARGHTLMIRRAHAMSTGVVAAGIDPVTGRLRGGADLRRERAIVSW